MNTVNEIVATMDPIKRFAKGGRVAWVNKAGDLRGGIIEGGDTTYAEVRLADGTLTEVVRTQCLKATPAILKLIANGEIAKSEKIDEELYTDEEYDEEYDEDGFDDEDEGIEFDEDEDEAESADVVPEKYKQKYAELGYRDCADNLAAQLRGLELDAAYAICAEILEIPASELVAKYAHLKNDGMRRMNAGNRARAALRRKAAEAEAAE